jgi:hypothetical protein
MPAMAPKWSSEAAPRRSAAGSSIRRQRKRSHWPGRSRGSRSVGIRGDRFRTVPSRTVRSLRRIRRFASSAPAATIVRRSGWSPKLPSAMHSVGRPRATREGASKRLGDFTGWMPGGRANPVPNRVPIATSCRIWASGISCGLLSGRTKKRRPGKWRSARRWLAIGTFGDKKEECRRGCAVGGGRGRQGPGPVLRACGTGWLRRIDCESFGMTLALPAKPHDPPPTLGSRRGMMAKAMAVMRNRSSTRKKWFLQHRPRMRRAGRESVSGIDQGLGRWCWSARKGSMRPGRGTLPLPLPSRPRSRCRSASRRSDRRPLRSTRRDRNASPNASLSRGAKRCLVCDGRRLGPHLPRRFVWLAKASSLNGSKGPAAFHRPKTWYPSARNGRLQILWMT